MNDAPRKKRPPLDLAAAAIAVTGLALVLGFIARGWHRAHWWPVAGFLLVAVAGGTYEVVTQRLMLRRAQRLRNAVPWNVPLERPRWLLQMATLIWIGAGLGAVPAAVGLPGVGLGLALALAGIALFLGLSITRMQPRRLTFESAGLRLGGRRLDLLLPWQAITNVEAMGSSSVWLHLVSGESIVSVEPDTPKNRKAAESILLKGAGDTIVMLADWAGGLDARTLTLAIEAARAGRREQPN
jgi:hypothetical protein